MYIFFEWGRMIKRFAFLILVFLASLLFYASCSDAYDVAVLKSAEIKPYSEALEGFRSSCDCEVEEMSHSDFSREIPRMNAYGVFAIGMDALSRLQTLKDLPVVFAMVSGLPPSNSFGRNVSGVNMYISPEKYLHAMLELFPDAKRIGVVYDPKNMETFVREALQVAQSLGVELVVKKASRPGEAPPLIGGMKDQIDVFWMLPDSTVVNSESVKFLLLFSFQNKIPVFTFSKKYVEMGAVAGLNIAPFDMGVQAGEIMKRLRTEREVKSPIRVGARKTVLMINSKVAKKMGIRMREEIARKAEDVN